MGETKDTFGVFKWYPEDGEGHFHPEDVSVAMDSLPSSAVLKCVGDSGDFITLRYRDLQFRAKPDLFEAVDCAVIEPGTKVKILAGSAANTEGQVEHIGWHFKDEKVVYRLSVDGKTRSRRYSDEEFERID